MIGCDLLTMEKKNITLTMMGFTLSFYLRSNIGFSCSILSTHMGWPGGEGLEFWSVPLSKCQIQIFLVSLPVLGQSIQGKTLTSIGWRVELVSLKLIRFRSETKCKGLILRTKKGFRILVILPSTLQMLLQWRGICQSHINVVVISGTQSLL
jgi:hypothetical protein